MACGKRDNNLKRRLNVSHEVQDIETNEIEMKGQNMDRASTHKPSKSIKLITIIKITECDLFYHEGENPYTQISISGLALDGTGDVVYATINDSADYGDDKRVKEFVSLYTPGSLHWVESQAFHWSGDELYFYYIEKSLPVADEDSEEIEKLFARNPTTENEPEMSPDESIIRIKASHVGKDMHDRIVVMSGLLEHIETGRSKRGLEMAFARLHDKSGYIDLIIFPSHYEVYEQFLLLKTTVNVTGKLSVSEDSSYLLPDKFELSR